MMFIVALYLPRCRYLAAQEGFQPQLYADNLKCLSRDPEVLLHAARFTTQYVRLVGQELAPSKCVLLSTSREVRKDMKEWVLSQEGYQWSVKFDVRDLGGHLDTTFRGWSSTLAARVRLVISRLVLIFVLPLDFHGRVRVVRSMYLPAALHGIEASFLASESLRKLRSAVRRVVWSRRQPLASIGAVISLLDGPTGCDPAFCVVWFRFRLLRRYLALWPAEVPRVYRLLEMVSEGCPGHGPIHLLSASAAEIGFRWDPHALAWVRPGLPLLSNLAGPIQHFRAAILDAGVTRLLLICVGVRGFGVVLLLTFMVLCSSLILLMFEKEIRVCCVASWLGVSGMVSCWAEFGIRLRTILVWGCLEWFSSGHTVPCRFCGVPDNDGHLFWDCPFPPLVAIRENPEFHDLMRLDKTRWPRCLLWHGWLPMLSGVNGTSPWAVDASECGNYLVETALGRYSSGLIVEVALGRYSSGMIADWNLPEGFDHDVAASSLSDHPDVWTDGSSVVDRLTGVSASGAGFFCHPF